MSAPEMAPYKPSRKIYQLQFEQFPGMAVHAYSASLGQIIDLDGMDRSKLSATQIHSMMELLADHIAVWNLVHPDIPQGKGDVCPRCGLAPEMPMPTAVKYMFCLDQELMLAIIFGWVTAMVRVSVPKEMTALSGSNEKMSELIKTLGELQNQATLPVPNFS